MKKNLLFLFTWIVLCNNLMAQIPINIPKPKTDTVKPANPNIPHVDLTPAYIINPGFEDGLFGWTANGPAFIKQVGGEIVASQRVRTEMIYANGGIGGDYWKSMPFPIGTKGQRWFGSSESGNGEGAIGSVMSSPFKMDRRYLHFLMGGIREPDKIYIELQTKESSVPGIGKTADGYTILKRLVPAINSDELFRYWFDLTQLMGLSETTLTQKPPTMRILIADFSTSGHLNVDDFLVSNCLPDFIKVKREGKTLMADKDHPVWGFADTHAHPMTNLSFGGRTMTGDPDGPMAVALGTDKCILNGHQPNATGINPSLMGWIVIQGYDWHQPEGYPSFAGWPRFDVDLHQPMYIDWIKRSYQGGLRLLSVLGVTNMFWATRALGVGVDPSLPIDDEAVLLLAIRKFKEIVGRNSSWMEIALTPQDARRIILENKLAIVLGCEMDNFGNFKDASYKFDENYPKPPSTPLVSLSLDPNQAHTQIKDKIKQYHDLGLRQFTAMHYISGVFGGTSVFRYQFGMIEATFTGQPFILKEGKDLGIDYHFYSDPQVMQTIFGNLSEYIKGDVKSLAVCDPNGLRGDLHACDNLHSTVNAHGLTTRGKFLYEELMNAGVVIDVDHTSTVSASEIFEMAKLRKYPLLSSHSDPQETCLTSVNGARFLNLDGTRLVDYQNYGTTFIGNISTEFTPTRTYYQNIANSGGMAGLFMFPFKKKQYGSQVVNDCDGSSKSFAQNYLYLQDLMKGKGIAFVADKGFAEAVGPRFGPSAAYQLFKENYDFLKEVVRTEQRMKQDNPVKYDIAFKDWNPKRFEEGHIDIAEQDMWKALAFFEVNGAIAGTSPELSPLYRLIPLSTDHLQPGRIQHYVRGLALSTASNLLATGLFAGYDPPWQQAIMYCFVHNTVPDNLPKEKYDGQYLTVVKEKYGRWKPVYDLWQRMKNGTNEPIRKLINGTRDWDFNLDGLAHYGMVPDFLQDLKNIGIRNDQFIPLFSSAEEYIRMWEKADSASGKRSSCTATSSSVNQTGCNSYTSPSGKHRWTVSGTYKDTIQNRSCCDSVITINLTITKVDTAVIRKNNVLTAHALNATYQWINCSTNQPVPNATSSSLSTATGNYAVRVTQSGCTATSSCYPITMVTIQKPINKPLSLPLQKFGSAIKIVASDRKNNSEFGKSVSISGNYAVVGVPYESFDVNNQNQMTQAGAAYIFEKNADNTWKQKQKIVPTDRTPGDHFGWSVGISGNSIIVGAIYDREDEKGNNLGTAAGTAYIFERSANGNWVQFQKISAGTYNYFGGSVAIDGNTIAVGAIGNSTDTTEKPESNINDAGAVFVFEKSGNTWKATQKLVADNRTIANLGDNLGFSVSVSGNYIIGGAWGSDFDVNMQNRMESAGAAYIFERGSTGWKQVQKLVASDRTPYDEFGNSVSISGNNAIVGAIRTTLNQDENYYAYTGTVYIFSRNANGRWSEVQKIIPDDRKAEDRLGASVAINGDYAAIAAPGCDSISPDEGAVYIYWQGNDGKWIQAQKLISSDHGTYAGMGFSTAISENFVIAGATIEHRDVAGQNELTNAGAAYIFMHSTQNSRPITNPAVKPIK